MFLRLLKGLKVFLLPFFLCFAVRGFIKSVSEVEASPTSLPRLTLSFIFLFFCDVLNELSALLTHKDEAQRQIQSEH